MKTTLDLPDELMKSVKLRAVEENRTMTDLIAELLRRGLAEEQDETKVIRNRVLLPLIHATHPPHPPDALSPERVAEILLAQEVEAHNDLMR
jgi:hypothetical protein